MNTNETQPQVPTTYFKVDVEDRYFGSVAAVYRGITQVPPDVAVERLDNGILSVPTENAASLKRCLTPFVISIEEVSAPNE